jgi:hypothetical protein
MVKYVIRILTSNIYHEYIFQPITPSYGPSFLTHKILHPLHHHTLIDRVSECHLLVTHTSWFQSFAHHSVSICLYFHLSATISLIRYLSSLYLSMLYMITIQTHQSLPTMSLHLFPSHLDRT